MELGNQQERQTADLNWLGGFFDGEGSIAIVATKKPYLWLSPMVRIINANFEMIEEVVRILKEHDVSSYVATLKPSVLGNRPTKHVHLAGMNRVKKVLELLKPYLRAKRNEADLVLEYVASRQATGKHSRYSDRELDIYIELRVIHGQKASESSETIRKGLVEARYSPTTVRKTVRTSEMSVPA